MFSFSIKNWFLSRILNRHRLLFQFWDGRQFRRVDPFTLLRKLLNTDKFDPDDDLKKLKIPDAKLVCDKIGHIAEGVREIFGVKPLENGGLTELECVNLLMEFSAYLDRVKKNGGPMPISQPVMGPAPSEVPDAGSVEVNDTSENSDSC
jgi:hypothetical protein